MKKFVPIILMILMIPTVTHAATITAHPQDQEVAPNSEKEIGQLSVNATPNETVDIQTDYPFEVTLSDNNFDGSKNVTVNATVRNSPGDYDLKFYVDNSTATTKITVPEVVGWNVTGHDFEENVSVGDEGKLGYLEVRKSGNVEARLDFQAEGNISDYLIFSPSKTLWTNEPRKTIIEYQIPKDTDFGDYAGNITVKGVDKNETVSLGTTFLDTIEPEVESVSAPDFMATKPKNFTVEVTDNLEVSSVTADITYYDNVVVNNTTEKVLKTYQTLNFTRQENTNQWTAEPKADMIEEYSIEGEACDESDNCDSFNSTFSINGLDVVKVDENVVVPKYKVDSDHSYKIGEVQSETPLNVTLSTFSEDLENTSFEIGIEQGGDVTKFFADKKTISFEEEEGDISIYVYSDDVGRYSGVLSYEPIDQHKEVKDTEFSGEFVNYTPPKDDSFDLAGKEYDCEAHASDIADNAYWTCSFKVKANNIENSLKEDMKTVIPQSYEENFIETKEEEVREALNKASTNFNLAILGITIGVSFLIGVIYYINSLDMIGFDQEDTEKLWRRY